MKDTMTMTMTMPNERSRALSQKRKFLVALSAVRDGSKVAEEVRLEAERLFRHFPDHGMLSFTHSQMPEWFGKVADAPVTLKINGISSRGK